MTNRMIIRNISTIFSEHDESNLKMKRPFSDRDLEIRLYGGKKRDISVALLSTNPVQFMWITKIYGKALLRLTQHNRYHKIHRDSPREENLKRIGGFVANMGQSEENKTATASDC